MRAEIIEKGDATFTIKYTAENGQESMLISMMSIATDREIYISASGDSISVGSVHVPVLETLSRKWGAKK